MLLANDRSDNPMKILLVDDEEETREMLERLLRHEGYSVDGCADGAGALMQIESNVYDVMMTDQTMPGMSGTELVKAAQAIRANLRCIVTSGRAATPDSVREGTTWLVKPLDVETIVAVLGPP